VKPILDRILPEIYADQGKLIQIRAMILSSIYSHHGDPRPLSIEAGVVCIGDATDMTTGRARSAYDQGRVTIHTISALSINQVAIVPGETVPVEIQVTMSNYAGLFQVQEILSPKITAGPIAGYVAVKSQFCNNSEI
jgi:metal-dependent HD superfamily phosphatase/phosphodiesterase